MPLTTVSQTMVNPSINAQLIPTRTNSVPLITGISGELSLNTETEALTSYDGIKHGGYEVGMPQAKDIVDLRTHAPVSGAFRYLKYHAVEGDGGHGVFRAIVGAAVGTYTDNNGTIFVPTGGDGSAAWVREIDLYATPEMFGGSSGMQNAINYAATSNIDLRLASTTYSCGKLYLRYDSVNNPGYPHGRATSIRIIGAGRISVNDEILGNLKGSVINSTVVTGTAVEFGPPSDGTSVQLGQSVLSDFTIRANTTGYVLDISHFHQSTMRNIFIRQVSPLGSGVLAPIIWESVFQDITVLGAAFDFKRNPGGYSSGIGFNISNIGGDMIGLDHVVCRGFNEGLFIDAPVPGNGNVTMNRMNNLICNYGLTIGSGIRNIEAINGHAELNTYSNIRVINGAKNCMVHGGYYLAATDTHHTSTPYILNDVVRNANNFYICVGAGLTGGASPPTGLVAGILDGAVTWDYVSSETDTLYTSIELQTGAGCDLEFAEITVNDGAAGVTSTSTAANIQHINHNKFRQANGALTTAIAIDNSSSTASAEAVAKYNTFDPAINSQISKTAGFTEYTDALNHLIKRVRVLGLSTGVNVNFSNDFTVNGAGSSITITGITSVHSAGTKVLLRLLGTAVTLQHNVTSFKLSGSANVTTGAVNGGAIFEFYTHNGTDWTEVSRMLP